MICNSQLAKYVKCLHYNLFAIPYVSRSEWEAAVDRLNCENEVEGLTTEVIASYDEYHKGYYDQILTNEHLAWADAFRRLLSLTSLEVSESLSGDQCQTKFASRVLRVLSRVYFYERSMSPIIYGAPRRLLPERFLARLNNLLTALHLTAGRLISLRFDGFCSAWIKLPDAMKWADRPETHDILRGVKIFNFSLRSLYSPMDAGVAQCLHRTVMKYAQKLEQLVIAQAARNSILIKYSLPPGFRRAHGGRRRMRIDHFFVGPARTPLITSLKLSRIMAPHFELDNLFSALAATLKELYLDEIGLYDGSCISMWRSMAEILKLRRLELSGDFRGVSEGWTATRCKCSVYRRLHHSTDSLCTCWPDEMYTSGRCSHEQEHSGDVLRKIESWIVSNGNGPFPIVPFYTPRCSRHHSPSKRLFAAYARESAARELLLDSSFNFKSDRSHYTQHQQPQPCPETCENFALEDDCIDSLLYQNQYQEQLVVCLMALQQGRQSLTTRSMQPDILPVQDFSTVSSEQQIIAVAGRPLDGDILPRATKVDFDSTVDPRDAIFASIFPATILPNSSGRQAIDLSFASAVIKPGRCHAPNIVRLVKDFISVVGLLDGKSLFENLDDNCKPMTASKQVTVFSELLRKAVDEGRLLQAAVIEEE